MNVAAFVCRKNEDILWIYDSLSPLCYLSLSWLRGCPVLQLFHTCLLRVADTFRFVSLNHCARSLVCNLHSKLGEDREKVLALTKRSEPIIFVQ